VFDETLMAWRTNRLFLVIVRDRSRGPDRVEILRDTCLAPLDDF